jgi:hypothetical protein
VQILGGILQSPKHPIDVGHQYRRFDLRIIAENVDRPFSVAWSEVQEHLEDQLSNEGAVFAS